MILPRCRYWQGARIAVPVLVSLRAVLPHNRHMQPAPRERVVTMRWLLAILLLWLTGCTSAPPPLAPASEIPPPADQTAAEQPAAPSARAAWEPPPQHRPAPPLPPDAATVSGRVTVAGNQAAVPFPKVICRVGSPNVGIRDSFSQVVVYSDRDGRFSFRTSPDTLRRELHFRIFAPGYQSAELDLPARRDSPVYAADVTFELEPLASISGRLSDATGRELGPGTRGLMIEALPMDPVDTATDSPWRSTGSYPVIKLVEFYWADAEGRALGPDGNPDGHYEVIGSMPVRGLPDDDLPRPGRRAVWFDRPSSDAVLRYRVLGLPPGYEGRGVNWFVQATLPDHALSAGHVRINDPGDRAVADLQLVPGTDLAGRVLDDAGQPVVDANVALVFYDPPDNESDDVDRLHALQGGSTPGQQWLRIATLSTMSGNDGVYRLPHLPAGRWSLIATAPGLSFRQPVVVDATLANQLHDISLDRGNPIRGRVTPPGILTEDASFRVEASTSFRYPRVSGAASRFRQQSYSLLMAAARIVVEDRAAGTFRVDGVRDGSFEVSVKVPGARAVNVTVRAGQSCELQVAPHGWIQGRLTLEATGQSPTGGKLELIRSGFAVADLPLGETCVNLPVSWALSAELTWSFDAGTGEYAIRGLPEHEYELRPVMPGCREWRAKVEVKSGRPTVLPLPVPDGYQLTVHVRDAKGRPASCTLVCHDAMALPTAGSAGVDATGSVDSSGTGTLVGIRYSDVRLLAHGDEGSAQRPVDLQHVTELTLVLRRPLEIANLRDWNWRWSLCHADGQPAVREFVPEGRYLARYSRYPEHQWLRPAFRRGERLDPEPTERVWTVRPTITIDSAPADRGAWIGWVLHDHSSHSNSMSEREFRLPAVEEVVLDVGCGPVRVPLNDKFAKRAGAAGDSATDLPVSLQTGKVRGQLSDFSAGRTVRFRWLPAADRIPDGLDLMMSSRAVSASKRTVESAAGEWNVPLVPGRYSVWWGDRFAGVVAVRASETVECPPRPDADTGSLLLELHGFDAGDRYAMELSLLTDSGVDLLAWRDLRPPGSDSIWLDDLPTGTHLLSFWLPGCARIVRPVTVRAGGMTTEELPAVDGHDLFVPIESSLTHSREPSACVQLIGADGRDWTPRGTQVERDNGFALNVTPDGYLRLPDIPAGTWTLRARSADGRLLGEVNCRTGDGAASPPRLILRER